MGGAPEQTSGKQDFIKTTESDGWEHVEGSKWRREVRDAVRIPYPRSGDVVWRKVKDVNSSETIEDREISRSTTRKHKHKVLRRPRSMEVVIDVCEEEEAVDGHDDEEILEGPEATQYRAISARVNYLSVDRADLQVCSKDASRAMSKLTRGDWGRLKRIGRYLLHKPRVAHLYRWQAPTEDITIMVDSNWAGCLKTRKSTTGMAIMLGGCLLITISRTQSNIALSPAEAELYAMVHAGSGGLGAKAMGQDFGMNHSAHLKVDASAAIGIAQRKGLGKVRHLDTQSLWIQDALRDRRLSLEKTPGAENGGDMMTKALDSKTPNRLMDLVGLAALEGRSPIAPHLTKDYMSIEDGTEEGPGRDHEEP